MAKSKKDFKYEITEILGGLSPEADLHAGWCKSVLKTLLNDEEDGIDIRNYNSTTKVMGSSGIRLTVAEANNLADLLISHGYGSMSVIEEEYKRRASILND